MAPTCVLDLKTLVGRQNLADFIIKEVTEVYEVDTDGRYVKTVAYLEDDTLAKAFAQIQTDSEYHHTERVWVLTNGAAGFVLGKGMVFSNDKLIRKQVEEKSLQKLTPEMRKVLRLE
jgi:hypothetical protein